MHTGRYPTSHGHQVPQCAQREDGGLACELREVCHLQTELEYIELDCSD